jgi:hypothetical protein
LALPYRFSFGGSYVRTQQTSAARDVDRVGLDAGDTGRCGRFAAPAPSTGLVVVRLLSRR